MKKIALLLAVVVILSACFMASCGNNNETSGTSSEAAVSGATSEDASSEAASVPAETSEEASSEAASVPAETSEEASTAAPVTGDNDSIAAGKSYTIAGNNLVDASSGVITYPDTGNKELTDGVIGEAANVGYASPIWVGFNVGASDYKKGYSEVVVDLGESKALSGFAIYTETCGAGISKAKEVEILYSDDNKNFTSAGKASEELVVEGTVADVSDAGIYKHSASAEVTARYISFRFAHTTNWVFVSEVEVYAA